MFVCIHVCMYLHVDVHMDVRAYICVYVCIYIHTHIHTHVNNKNYTKKRRQRIVYGKEAKFCNTSHAQPGHAYCHSICLQCKSWRLQLA
jgi:hypothetical protein